mmetsp:Transcript_14936/g.16524  ORF Transcript_14936/g.16524 Transcript_14936/m.16524 type:complete len:462 (+) Transcript_14936:127-1512(+)
MPRSMTMTTTTSEQDDALSGLCNQCGTKLFDIKHTKKLFSSEIKIKRTPLTRQGSCLKGECMKCNISNPMSMPFHNNNNNTNPPSLSRSLPHTEPRRMSATTPSPRNTTTTTTTTAPRCSSLTHTTNLSSSHRGGSSQLYHMNNDHHNDVSDYELAIAMSMMDVQEIERRPNSNIRIGSSSSSKEKSNSPDTTTTTASLQLGPGAYNVVKNTPPPNFGGNTGMHDLMAEDSTAQQDDLIDATYEGDYNAIQQRHGQGFLTFTNGDYFVGTFVNGQRQGTGSYYWKDGSVYEGEWYQNTMHGKGKRVFSNGNVYTGSYVHGKRCGQGICHFTSSQPSKSDSSTKEEDDDHDGDVYEGMWEDDVPHGHGRYYYARTQQSFEGTFEKGKRHGVGKYQLKDGRLDICKYTNNKRNHTGVRWSKSRNRTWKIDAEGKELKRITVKVALELQKEMGYTDNTQKQNQT